MPGRRLVGISTLAVVVVSAISFGAEGPGGEGGSNFEGKVLVLFHAGDTRAPAYILEKVRFVSIGSRAFLVGQGADTKRPNDFRQGVEIGVAWDTVTSYLSLSTEQYAEYLAGAQTP